MLWGQKKIPLSLENTAYYDDLFEDLWVFCLFFRAKSAAYGGFQTRDRIGATAAGLCHSHSNAATTSEPRLWHDTTAHANAGSLIHWARPGIEPMSSWILVRFISAEPRWELLFLVLLEVRDPELDLRGQAATLAAPDWPILSEPQENISRLNGEAGCC